MRKVKVEMTQHRLKWMDKILLDDYHKPLLAMYAWTVDGRGYVRFEQINNRKREFIVNFSGSVGKQEDPEKSGIKLQLIAV